jgi:hypothetical protein
MFQLNQNKQKTHPNSLKESIFGYFSTNLGLFRFVSKQFCLFRLFRYRFETPKQTEIFYFWFHETTEINAKQILFQFVSVRTEIYFCLFRGHPSLRMMIDNVLLCIGSLGMDGWDSPRLYTLGSWSARRWHKTELHDYGHRWILVRRQQRM